MCLNGRDVEREQPYLLLASGPVGWEPLRGQRDVSPASPSLYHRCDVGRVWMKRGGDFLLTGSLHKYVKMMSENVSSVCERVSVSASALRRSQNLPSQHPPPHPRRSAGSSAY